MYKILILNNNVQSKIFNSFSEACSAANEYKKVCESNNFKITICIFDTIQNEIRCTI